MPPGRRLDDHGALPKAAGEPTAEVSLCGLPDLRILGLRIFLGFRALISRITWDLRLSGVKILGFPGLGSGDVRALHLAVSG